MTDIEYKRLKYEYKLQKMQAQAGGVNLLISASKCANHAANVVKTEAAKCVNSNNQDAVECARRAASRATEAGINCVNQEGLPVDNLVKQIIKKGVDRAVTHMTKAVSHQTAGTSPNELPPMYSK